MSADDKIVEQQKKSVKKWLMIVKGNKNKRMERIDSKNHAHLAELIPFPKMHLDVPKNRTHAHTHTRQVHILYTVRVRYVSLRYTLRHILSRQAENTQI